MYFKITLSTSGGLLPEHLDIFKSYFTQCPHAFLAVEYGKIGLNCHVEGIVDFDVKKTSSVRDRLKRLYLKKDIPWCPQYSVKIKIATHLVGAFIYARKEFKAQGKMLLIRGWTQTWIDQQVKDNVKAISYKSLMHKWTPVTQRTGGPLMWEWCNANNKRITSKYDFALVMRLMCEDGYLFGTLKDKGLYRDVMACFGDGRAAEAQALESLHFV